MTTHTINTFLDNELAVLLGPGRKVSRPIGVYFKGSGEKSKKALEERGWFFNADRESPFWDYKFCLKSKEISAMAKALKPHQVVNNFVKASTITTKVGLLRSMRNLCWFEPLCMIKFTQTQESINACEGRNTLLYHTIEIFSIKYTLFDRVLSLRGHEGDTSASSTTR